MSTKPIEGHIRVDDVNIGYNVLIVNRRFGYNVLILPLKSAFTLTMSPIMLLFMSKKDTYFQKAIDELGMSQRDAARFFGKNERTARRWASGDKPDKMAIMIIEFMRRYPMWQETLQDISKEVGSDDSN